MTPFASAFVVGIAIGLFLLRFRTVWLSYKIEEYTVTSTMYALQTGQSERATEEMKKLWPSSHMTWELWRWDFSRYVVYQGHYEDMREWLGVELLKDDTTAELWKIEKEMVRKAQENARTEYEKDVRDEKGND